MKALITVLALLAGAQAFAQETCFNTDRIWDFRVVNDRTLVLRETGARRFRVDVSFCNLRWADRIAFRSFSYNYVCRNDEIYVFETAFSKRPEQVCKIRRITRI